ncbi:alpha/beta hydrolase [SAR116 cluster bacterium]|nr:alpha/beta hydrolase [SAR116 cluster bacterium]
MKNIFVKGTSVNLVSENGPYVILIHGLGLNKDMWEWQTRDLSKNYSLITYDLIGHGESKDPEKNLNLEIFSDQIFEIIEYFSLDKIALVGFSLGGMIARKFALKYNDRLWALAILNSAHKRTNKAKEAVQLRVNSVIENGPQSTIEDALERWFTKNFREKNPIIMDRIRKWVLANKKEVYPKAYQVLVDGVDELLQSPLPVNCPSLVLTGDEDFGNSPEMSQEISKQILKSQLEILPGMRHMALIEDFQKVNKILSEFLLGTLNS